MAIIKPEQLSSGTYNISGSFSGSFHGNGSNLTNLPQEILQYTSSINFPLPTGSSNYLYLDKTANNLFSWDELQNDYVLLNSSTTPPSGSEQEGGTYFADLATTNRLNPYIYNNGISGSGATLTGINNGIVSTIDYVGRIDNIVPTTSSIILVKNETAASASRNGLYEITNLGSPSSSYILTRVDYYDTGSEIYPSQVTVITGSLNRNSIFVQQTINPIVGSSPINFTQSPTTANQILPVVFLDTVTTSNLVGTYSTGSIIIGQPGAGATLTATSSGALGVIGNITASSNTRILVVSQSNPAHNGDYLVTNPGSATQPWKLTRWTGTWSNGLSPQVREWVISRFGALEYGSRYVIQSASIANNQIGTAAIIYNKYLYPNTGSGTSIPVFPYTGSAIITGSLTITGSIMSTQGFTGSLLGTASLASTASFIQTAQTASYITSSNVVGTVTSASYALSASYAPSTIPPTGPIGITNSSGVYTYYNSFSASMAAAVSGQTIEFFADIIETGSISVNLKDNVNINGNGYTYTLNSTSSANCIQDNGSIVYCSISNITFKRINNSLSGQTSTSKLCMHITGPSIIKAHGTKLIGTTQGSSLTNTGALTINNPSAQIFGIYAEGYNPAITITSGQLIDSVSKSFGGAGIIVDVNGFAVKCVAYGFGNDGIYSTGTLIDCTGYGQTNNGITAAGGLIQNCTGYGGGGFGLSITGPNTIAISCTGYSPSIAGIYTNSTRAIGLRGYSIASFGIYLINGILTDCIGYSTANNGIYMENSGGTISELRSCKAISTVAAAIRQNNLTSGSKILNTEAICRWNNSAGHAIVLIGNNTQVAQCVLEVTNPSANCLNASSNLTSKYANNIFSGTITPVNTNIIQGVFNTHDNQGNILL